MNIRHQNSLCSKQMHTLCSSAEPRTRRGSFHPSGHVLWDHMFCEYFKQSSRPCWRHREWFYVLTSGSVTQEVGNRSVPITVTRASGTVPLGESEHRATWTPKVQNTHNLRTTLEKGRVAQILKEEKLNLDYSHLVQAQ